MSLVLVGSLVLVARGDQQPADSAAVSSPVAAQQAALNRYCVSCHNDKMKSAGLSLSGMDVTNPSAHSDVWEKVVRKLNGRAMPPIGRPRPDDATYESLVAYLEASLDRIASGSPNPGRTETFRRLTRTEYRNAIRDLLAVDVEVQSLLPPDDSSFGFDNVTVGTLSPTLMERYLAAAQKISRLAIGSTVRVPQTHVVTLPVDLTQEQHFSELPLGTRGGTVFPHTFPVDGEYEIQVRLYRDRDEHVEGLGRQGRGDDSVSQKHELELTLDGQQVTIFTVQPPTSRSSNDPRDYDDSVIDKDFNVRIPVKAGPHEIAATFLKKPSVLLETVRQPYPVAFNMDRHPRMQPAVFKVVVTGPFDPTGAGDTPSRRRIFTCRPASAGQESGCAKRIISAFVRRAYRRPVTDEDLKTPMAFYEQGRMDGGFEAGIETALRKILIAPEFLFRVERDPVSDSSVYRISDIELASRLSFFLWSSIPDDQLLDVAARGKLRDPKVLDQQVRRMLADARSSSLVDNFAGQWLYLRNLAALQPDGRMFTTFDDNLRQAFKQETELFFDSIMRENRSVLDLLNADYTFLDERLAKHYGVPDVYGTQFRRVTLPAGSVRGGLLGQGSILLATSYANRTSPVLRGKWVLENIMGTPPPAPPPGVPPLKENKSENHMPTMRERMAQHRDNPACSSCHMLMDPIGLSMENFDAIGRWRTKGEDGAPVDATGGLPNGQTFEGVSGLKQALLRRPELFVAAVTEKLLTFALGRGIEPYDGPAVRAILRDSRADNYRFATVVSNIVKSTPFQMRSASRAHATN
jgi:mono/diheme cytochrome c family protein